MMQVPAKGLLSPLERSGHGTKLNLKSYLEALLSFLPTLSINTHYKVKIFVSKSDLKKKNEIPEVFKIGNCV